jgi:hypothetical protein
VKSIPLSVVALILLVVGIFGLSMSNTEFVRNLGRKSAQQGRDKRKAAEDGDYESSINNPKLKDTTSGETTPLIDDDDKDHPKSSPSLRNSLLGVTCALVLGLMNGSMMVPLRFTPKDATGINYMASFGIGVLVVTPVCALVYFLLVARRFPPLQLRVALIPGLITGLIWNVGNFCTVYATLYLGLTIGFPLTQVALVVSGLWGILVFKEITAPRSLVAWFLSLLVLLGGAALLSLFG